MDFSGMTEAELHAHVAEARRALLKRKDMADQLKKRARLEVENAREAGFTKTQVSNALAAVVDEVYPPTA